MHFHIDLLTPIELHILNKNMKMHTNPNFGNNVSF